MSPERPSDRDRGETPWDDDDGDLLPCTST